MNFKAASCAPLRTAASIKSAAIGKDQSTVSAVAPFGWCKRHPWVHNPKAEALVPELINRPVPISKIRLFYATRCAALKSMNQY